MQVQGRLVGPHTVPVLTGDICLVQYKDEMKAIRPGNEQGVVEHPSNLELSKPRSISHSSLRWNV